MQSPLMLYPDQAAILPLRYYGSISHYATMAAFGKTVICAGELFEKRRKSVHRCEIADTHGRIQLTVPVAKPHGIDRARWSDVRVSDHGAWWHVHRVTLESAYGRTPFFEFYIDRFLQFLNRGVVDRYQSVADLDMAIDAEIRSILMIDTEVVADYQCNTPAHTPGLTEASQMPPYWQVRGSIHGFMADLSVLDLIFNLGPEAPLYLKSLLK